MATTIDQAREELRDLVWERDLPKNVFFNELRAVVFADAERTLAELSAESELDQLSFLLDSGVDPDKLKAIIEKAAKGKAA